MLDRSYDELLARLERLRNRPAFRLEYMGAFPAEDRGYPLALVRVGEPGAGKRGVMVAAGIHGDEPAGVEAAMEFMERRAADPELLSKLHLVIFPCNNPTGWERNTRENWQGIDLNRQFNLRRPAPEVELIMQGLQGKCFDLIFEMHEDVDSPGFYMYEIAEDSVDHVGEDILHMVSVLGCPINTADCIEGAPAEGGLIRRKLNLKRFRKTRLPQAIYAYRTCGGHVITLEPPASLLTMEQRVEIQLKALDIALRDMISRD